MEYQISWTTFYLLLFFCVIFLALIWFFVIFVIRLFESSSRYHKLQIIIAVALSIIILFVYAWFCLYTDRGKNMIAARDTRYLEITIGTGGSAKTYRPEEDGTKVILDGYGDLSVKADGITTHLGDVSYSYVKESYLWKDGIWQMVETETRTCVLTKERP